MAKFSKTSKWKKRTLTALSIALASSFTLGLLAACTTEETTPEEDDSTVSATDTQLLRNGNFEFYNEKETEIAERLTLINSPTSWAFTSGSPSSTTTSGVIDASEEAWGDLTRSGGYNFTTYTYSGENDDYDGEEVTTFASIADAMAHWTDENVSAYDKLYFLEIYGDDIDELDETSAEAEFFAEYDYGIDYEDVRYLTEACSNGRDFRLHEGVAEDETGVLMLHNTVTSNNVVGTAQYYTSATTITIPAGAAASLSVWVKTDNLYHYISTDNENPTQTGTPVSQRAGAYIGVTNTVGGTTLDQMQIKNINTQGEWQQYNLYVRASTYATTTFRIVLGLGQGSSSDRYYNVNGYAFFDDLTCELITGEEYEEAVGTKEAPANDARVCAISDSAEEKQFDMDRETADTFALDLYAAFEADGALLSGAEIGLTEERSGSRVYTSERFGLGDDENNFAQLTTLGAIAASSNRYLQNVYTNDIEGKYPFGGDDSEILMLMSANGAAYTAKLAELTLGADERMLVSFFVKTSSIPSGYSGATASVVELLDGAALNTTSISAFDSTTIDTVDIDSSVEEKTDIYDGWVQCFFFIENDTKYERTFRIDLSYGPTTITGTTRTSYCDGYAAFTNFETKTLTSTELSYATTGDQAVSVSLTGETEETRSFDNVSATGQKDIETGLALPAAFTGVLGGSKFVTSNGADNIKPESVYTGLLSSRYAENYFNSEAAWKDILGADAAGDADSWWNDVFGNARQPLVIANGEEASYGYFSSNLTVAASSYQQISLRVRVSEGAKAYIYLTNLTNATTASELLSPSAPLVTFWYNDEGDICSIDPTSDDYNRRTHVLFTLQENGLYQRTDGSDETYYANLYNYETDEEGNLVTADGTIAFYANEGTFYAYYDEETDTYSQPVENLPTEVDGTTITRYDFRNTTMPQSQIVVDNTDGSLPGWVTVSFYVATGDEELTYRLEVFSGDRLGTDPNPADSYVLFDNYINADVSSDYTTLRDEAVDALKLKNNVSDKDNLPESLALYYTFTFYDADFYLRYDATQDEDDLGNPYGSYTQSEYTENIIYLYVDDIDGTLLNVGPSYAMYIDYSSTDVTVEADDLGSSDNNSDSSDTTTTDINEGQLILLISSSLIAIVLFIVIILMIVRKLMKKFRKKAKPVSQVKKSNKLHVVEDEAPAQPEAPAPEKKDEDDPYND